MKFITQQLQLRLQMISDKQSVYCFTAYAQTVFLLVECITSDVDATAWSVIAQSMILWSTSATIQPDKNVPIKRHLIPSNGFSKTDVSWRDWRHKCMCDTPAAPVCSTLQRVYRTLQRTAISQWLSGIRGRVDTFIDCVRSHERSGAWPICTVSWVTRVVTLSLRGPAWVAV